MRTDEIGLRAAFSWVASGLVLLNIIVTAVALGRRGGGYAPVFAEAVLSLIAVLALVAARRLTQGRGARPQFAAMVAVAVVALAAHPWLWRGDVGYPPLFHVLGAVATVTAVASVRWSFVVVPGFAAGVALLRTPTVGAPRAISDAVLLSLGGLVATACVVVFARAARSVHAAVERAWQVTEERARLEERAGERERWDGLVHDTVLGALSLASRAVGDTVPAAARDLAREAREVLVERVPSSGAPLELWARHAERLGLTVGLDVEIVGAPDAEVTAALVGAVNEALTNAARHSGTAEAWVSGRVSVDAFTVVVADLGRGFDAAAGTGLGLRTSVIARMRAVGGVASVSSTPGGGTRVTVQWRASFDGARDDTARWELTGVAPMVALGWGVSLAAVGAGFPVWSATRQPALSVLVVVAVLVLLAATVAGGRRRGSAAWLASGVVATAIAGVVTTPADAPGEWRYWYLGALTPTVAALAYRLGARVSVPLTAALGIVVGAVDTLAGRAWWGVLNQPVATLVVTVIAAAMLRRALEDAWETVEEATREGAELRVALAAEAERAREARARAEALERVAGDALERLAAGGSLDAEERRELGLLGATVRDQLAAPDLVDDAMLDALRAARTRGATVDLVAPSPPRTDAGGDPLALCRRVLAVILAHADQGVRVRVAWEPTTVERTIAVVGAHVPTIVCDVADAVGGEPRVVLIADDDALLVRVGGGPRPGRRSRVAPDGF